jgi:putative aldouronate transport system permease protein
MNFLSHQKKRIPAKDRLFEYSLYLFFSLLIIGTLYPLWFVFIASFSNPNHVANGKVLFLPVSWTLKGYKALLSNSQIWRGYGNTILYTLFGTLFQLFVNIPAGYARSRPDLYGKKWVSLLFVIPLFVSGGLIPTYLNIQRFGLLDNPLVLIIPFSVSCYNILVIRAFFKQNIPSSLWEAAQMDGCSVFRFFIQIVLPLSKAILAVIGLWVAVGIWNSWFDAMIYLRSEQYQPLQLILRRILILNDSLVGQSLKQDLQQQAEMMKYAAIVVSTLPIMCLYPFLQKYFNQGVMVGSVKE